METHNIELKHSFDTDLMIYIGETYGKCSFEFESFNQFMNVILMRGLHSFNEMRERND